MLSLPKSVTKIPFASDFTCVLGSQWATSSWKVFRPSDKLVFGGGSEKLTFHQGVEILPVHSLSVKNIFLRKCECLFKTLVRAGDYSQNWEKANKERNSPADQRPGKNSVCLYGILNYTVRIPVKICMPLKNLLLNEVPWSSYSQLTGVRIWHQSLSCFPFESCHLSQLDFHRELGFPEAQLLRSGSYWEAESSWCLGV